MMEAEGPRGAGSAIHFSGAQFPASSQKLHMGISVEFCFIFINHLSCHLYCMLHAERVMVSPKSFQRIEFQPCLSPRIQRLRDKPNMFIFTH